MRLITVVVLLVAIVLSGCTAPAAQPPIPPATATPPPPTPPATTEHSAAPVISPAVPPVVLSEPPNEAPPTSVPKPITTLPVTPPTTVNVTQTTPLVPPAPPAPKPATQVGGVLSGEVLWTESASPYTLTGHIQVPQGSSLTLEPGVRVELNDRFIQVDGTLRVLGTPDRPVTIVGTMKEGPMITLSQSCVSYDENSGSGTIIRNATINGESFRIITSIIEVAGNTDYLDKRNSQPRIEDSRLTLTGSTSAVIGVYGGSPQIVRNTITSNTNGITVWDSSPQLLGNVIRGPKYAGTGIAFLAKAPTRIERNVVTGFNTGLLSYSGNADVLANNINDNQTGIILGDSARVVPTSLGVLNIRGNVIKSNGKYNVKMGFAVDIDMSGNWWGTTDPVAIEAKLYHKPQDFRLGSITYPPFLTSMPVDVPSP